MNNQNILKFYGSKLDVSLDSSEYYDYEISKVETDYVTEVLDLTTPIIHSSQIIDSECLNTFNTPWEIPIDVPYVFDNCDFNVRRRTEKGWTLNFVFNKGNNPWVNGGTFYYLGLKDEFNDKNYLDNNLSFSFTTDGRIKWESIHYSGYCSTNSGYTGTSYTLSGETPILCENGTLTDFNITITFDRNKRLTDCNLVNDGGQNDLITGWTVTNVLGVMTGDTENFDLIETLNKKWISERNERLGVLKIYLNGRPIYKMENWEEIIPSQRESINELVQIWGGGTSGSGGIHNESMGFNLKRIQYFEEPLGFIFIRHHYLLLIKPFYIITECNGDCVDDVFSIGYGHIITEAFEEIITEDGYSIIYKS
jgi:hypothetical protein